jgi:hypothetical protein
MRARIISTWAATTLLPLWMGCANGSTDVNVDGPVPISPGSGPGVAVSPTTGFGAQSAFSVSTPPVRSAVAPAPINGGTLLVTKDDLSAVAADPDRDRVVIVDLKNAQVVGTIQLEARDEPGRLVEDGAGRVHVVLRRSGQLATISLAEHTLLSRRQVCPTPQGIAYDAKADSLLVACTSGELVTLPAAGGPASRSVHVDLDLRDVIVTGDQVFVSRFKSAELLELDAEARVISRRTPNPMDGLPVFPGATHTFAPAVAWRAFPTPDGNIAMLHQRAQVEPVELHSETTDGGVPNGGPAPVCTSGCMKPPPPLGPAGALGGSVYGGGQACGSIVQSSVSTMDMAGSAPISGPMLANVTLAVDSAVSPDGQFLAVAVAGNSDGTDDTVRTPFGQISVVVVPLTSGTDARQAGNCLQLSGPTTGGTISSGQVTAVAFDSADRLVIQMRDPNRIRVTQNTTCFGCAPVQFDLDVDMGGEARRDTGHDLFHLNAGAGLACASCHPGGGDDGRAWAFKELGPRRTQLFNMGIRDTLPLHWDGELPTFQALIQEVFERRMGGPVLDPERIQVMSDWVDSLRPNAPIRSAGDPAVTRGKTLFESTEVGCSGCHNGQKLTNNTSVDVGTGGTFQVPSLVGVAYHQPYIHSGCAQNLRQRFDPACGGTQHGKTAGLNEDQLGDLVAYLESL